MIELHRAGARFTWTNNQDNPVRCVLDRVFVSTEWEAMLPARSLVAEIRLGSNHCPLILHSGEEFRRPAKWFFFERQWLLRAGFAEGMTRIWVAARVNRPHRYGPLCDALDEWKRCICRSWHYLRGLGANVGGQTQVCKEALLSDIKALDVKADTVGLS